jgi:hypothetical protein
MLDFLSHVGKGGPDPLASVASADAFFKELPANDPVACQRTICDALAQIGARRGPDINRLRALITLDRRAQPLVESLLAEYVSSSAQSSERERQLRHAAFELCRSFAGGYEYFLRHVRERRPGPAWLQRVPTLLVHLFRQREVEVTLALFRYESWPRGRWREANVAFQFALSEGLARLPVVVERRDGKPDRTITAEQMFVRLLLLQLLDGGQFVLSEISVARQWIARWSESLSLTPLDLTAPSPMPSDGFVTDIAGAAGVTRSGAASTITGEYLHLDTAPLVAIVEREIAAATGSLGGGGTAALVQARRAALLRKLATAFAPRRERVKRRGERTEVALASVQVMVGGLASIFRMLRDESRRLATLARSPVPEIDEITITDTRGYVGRPGQSSGRTADGASAFPSTASFGVPQPAWQVRDRSESGCRLRGRVSLPQRVMPGSLIAFREDESAPWTVAVVRRLKKVMGNNVEIGVEYVGRNPQRILLTGDAAPAEPAGDASGKPAPKFAALFLPESEGSPKIPIKTIVVPAAEYQAGRELVMISTMHETAIRLKDPLEQQGAFVWASFEALGAPRGRR